MDQTLGQLMQELVNLSQRAEMGAVQVKLTRERVQQLEKCMKKESVDLPEAGPEYKQMMTQIANAKAQAQAQVVGEELPEPEATHEVPNPTKKRRRRGPRKSVRAEAPAKEK